jgi:hypothetical protein
LIGRFLEENVTMKFDAVVMNPPYIRFECLRFLNQSLNNSCIIIPILPARFILNQKDTKRTSIEIEVLKKLEGHISYIKLLNGNKYFSGVYFTAPLCILNINMKESYDSINVEDKISDNIYKVKTLNELNQYSYYVGYENLKTRILNQAAVDNIQNYITILTTKNRGINEKKNWYVHIAKIRGHVNHKNENIHSDDYYTFVPRDASPVKSKPKNNMYVSFDTELKAKNFIEYLKTDFARFALSMYKTGRNMHRKELKSVPWFDYTKRYTDAILYKMFNITKDEIKFIESIIPKYYENKRFLEENVTRYEIRCYSNEPAI